MVTSLSRAAAVAVPALLVLLAPLTGCGTDRAQPSAAASPGTSEPAPAAAPTTAPVTPGQVGPTHARGALLSVEPLRGLDAEQVRGYLSGQGVDGSRVRFGVDTSRISYATVDPEGRQTTASALVATPRTPSTPRTAADQPGGAVRPLVSWQHGTTAGRDEVASMTEDGSDRAAAVMFAAAGYVVSAPDYLGLGTGAGYHPYLDLPSTVTASVDSLRATRALAERNGPRLDAQVLVSGHSQGGQAAMAVGRELRRGAAPEFRLAAVAPIAGPYDVSGTLRTAATTGIENASAYLAYFTVAWNRLHHLYDSPAQAFRPPYAASVTELLDGYHSGPDVLAALPATPAELFTPEFLHRLANPSGTLAEALAVADGSCDWRPGVPVRLFAASGDRDVPIANSGFCQRRVRAAGGDAALIDVGPVDHATSELRALPQVLAGFDQLTGARQGG